MYKVSIDRFEEPLSQLGDMKSKLSNGADFDSIRYGAQAITLVEIVETRKRTTRNGKDMAFVSFETYDGESMEAVSFGKQAKTIISLDEHDVALLLLEKEFYNGEASWRILDVQPFGKE